MHHVNTNLIPVSLDESTEPNWYSEPLMRDKEQPRSIRFPQSLWDAIDRDALRCKRSAVKQMEAVLSEYYRLSNVNLNSTALDFMNNEDMTRVEIRPQAYQSGELQPPTVIVPVQSDGVIGKTAIRKRKARNDKGK